MLSKNRTTETVSQIKSYISSNLTIECILSDDFIALLTQIYPLESLALLDKLIDKRAKETSLDSSTEIENFQSILLQDFSSKYSNLELPILVCLDEFELSDSSWGNSLLFFRNLIRLISNLIPVLLGTNAKISNMIQEQAKHSSPRSPPKLWCRMLLKLPQANLSTLDISADLLATLNAEVKYWLSAMNMRPGVLNLCVDFLVKKHHGNSRHLKTVFEKTLKRLIEEKNILIETGNMDGYYQMLFSRFHASTVKEHNCALEMVNRHLAHILPDKLDHFEKIPVVKNLFKIGERLGYYESRPFEDLNDYSLSNFTDTSGRTLHTFEPTTIYLDLQKDELINMIVFSDWSKIDLSQYEMEVLSEIFADFEREIETAVSRKDIRIFSKAKQEVIKRIKNSRKINIFSLSFRLFIEILHNTKTDDGKIGKSVRSGNKLEQLIIGSFVKSSTSAGPFGSRLDIFLLNFVSELSLEKLFDVKWGKKAIKLLKPLKRQLVPYVIAANYEISNHFQAIPYVFTGSIPDLKNSAQLDGRCIPDWVGTISQRSASTLPHYANAVHFSKIANYQMYITMEMNNYNENIDGLTVKSVLVRAVLKGRKFAEKWPAKHNLPIRHLHLFCVSSLAEIKDWNIIHHIFSPFVKIYMMSYNSTEKILNLEDMLDIRTPDISSLSKTDIEFLEQLKKARLPTNIFPHSTVIIVSLKDLFGFGFESLYNLTSEPPSIPRKHANEYGDDIETLSSEVRNLKLTEPNCISSQYTS